MSRASSLDVRPPARTQISGQSMGAQTLRVKNCQNHKRPWNQQFYTIIPLRWEVWSGNFVKCLICRVVVRVKSYCCSAQDRTGWQCSWSSVEGRILQSCLASWSVVQLSVRWLRLTTQLVFYDNNGLESRSDGDWPYGRTPKYIQTVSVTTLRVYDFLTRIVVVLSFSTISYLVDPASSHMLVSKIKPCMSKYKPH